MTHLPTIIGLLTILTATTSTAAASASAWSCTSDVMPPPPFHPRPTVDHGATAPHPTAPRATTPPAFGDEDTLLVIKLEGVDPLNADARLDAIVTALPARGALMQFDGTPITQTPSLVLDPQGRVRYLPPAHENGSRLTHLTHCMRRAVDGVRSAERRVPISLNAVNDPPQIVANLPEVFEDTTTIFDFVIVDPDIHREGDAHTVFIVSNTSPMFGTLHQLGADGVTLGEAIGTGISGPVALTNPRNRVAFVPASNFNHTSALVNLMVKVEDSAGAESSTLFIPFAITAVNDPPTASNGTTGITNYVTQVKVALGISDIDSPLTECVCIIKSLPSQGTLYTGSIHPSNAITAPEFHHPASTSLWYVPIDPEPSSNFDSFMYSASDGEYESDIAEWTIIVAQGNTQPTVGAILTTVIAEDSGPVVIDIPVSDLETPPELLHVSIAAPPSKGVLQVKAIIGGHWLNVYGTDTKVNHYPFQVRYIPAPDDHSFGVEPITFTVTAIDASGSMSAPSVGTISITAVNDPPLIQGSDSAAAQITFPGFQHISAIVSDLQIFDDAAGHQVPLMVTITAQNALSLELVDAAGLESFNQVSPTEMTFTGTLEAINDCLAMGLVFDPLNWGTGSITVIVNDLGSIGEQPENPSLSDTHVVTVFVTP